MSRSGDDPMPERLSEAEAAKRAASPSGRRFVPSSGAPVAAPPEADKTVAGPIFDVEDVHVFYGEHRAIRDVTMRLGRNEITALIGPSGCGKSTFIRCLNRMNDLIPTARVEGHVVYHDEDLYDPRIDPVQVRKRIGMVFQKPNPFPKSIYDNIAFGPRVIGMKGDMDEIVESALRRAALWDETKDRLRTNAFGMSGGQQQRLCIARALATQPDVLLMDEPCSALDPISTGRIEDLMMELKQEYSIVIVTHNMQQAARVSDMTAFFTVELDDSRQAPDRPRGRVRRDGQDLHEPAGQADRGLRHGQVRLMAAREAHRLRLPGRAADARGAGARRARHGRRGAGPHDGGARAPGHRARVAGRAGRRPARRALSRGPPGDPVAAGAPGARGRRPAGRGGAAARHPVGRADGRPVREHRQAAAGGRLRGSPWTRNCARGS